MERFTLTTDRLILRPFQPADVDDVLGYAGDEDFGRYVPTVPYPYQRQDAKAFVGMAGESDGECVDECHYSILRREARSGRGGPAR